jgi:hypothetical protein
MRVIFLLLAPFLAITACCLETSLLLPSELRKRVPMAKITDFKKSPLFVRTPDFLLASSDTGPPFSLQGRDKRGRDWRVRLRDASRGAWRSETNGRRTYYFVGYTGAAGMGPATWILALSFDKIGRPVPFVVTTHGGIEDVLDLDGTGAELLVQDYQGTRMDDPGYYVTTLYQQRGLYWYRSDGQHGAHTFPTSEKWSVMWKDQPAVLMTPPVFKGAVGDSSNDPAAGVRTGIMSAVENNSIHITPSAGCSNVALAVLVWDTPAGRRIELEELNRSLKTLAQARATVVLTGLYHWPKSTDCGASILWASTER